MGVIHCCGGLRRSQSFVLEPENGYVEARFDWLESCPVCSHTVLQLTRVDFSNKISIVRKTNLKARNLRERLEGSIITQIKDFQATGIPRGGTFYLYYNEFGKRKKCFSNLSQIKIGAYENIDLKKNIFCNTVKSI